MITKIIRLFNTLKHLRLAQLFYFIVRRKLPASRVIFSGDTVSRSAFTLSPALSLTGLWSESNRFSFLNVDKRLVLPGFDWSPEDVPRLWRYNLHYFDYLRERTRSDDDKYVLLESWVVSNPQGSQPGWEPFTASLRIVNWVFYLQRCPSAQTPAVMRSLYTQVLWLERNDERHILANHYFENLKALAFAGSFFEGADAQRWLRKGQEGVRLQLAEQTLNDGGHYERTPQYHGLMLENYLDLLNLASHNPSFFPISFTELLKQHCVIGLGFYQQIVFPDQQLPLFNDTAFGISPSLDTLDSYFQRLAAGESCLLQDAEAVISLPESGIFGYRSREDMWVVDAGDIGPSYQPGHTHCDMLSYELMLSGERIIVDTGVCEYQPGPVRRQLRSTRAHNTVSVNGAEQSEVWGEFRVARRAKILAADIKRQDESILFSGGYQGFHCLGGRVQHWRTAALELANNSIASVMIKDRISGSRDRHNVESFIHLHPDIQLTDRGSGVIDLLSKAGQQLQLIVASEIDYAFEESFYYPEFGVKIANTRVVLKRKAGLTCDLSYIIRRQ